MSRAAASTSNIIDNNASEDESIISDNHDSLNSQYFVNFVRNKHKETIIDHMIDNDDMDEEDLFVIQEENSTTDSEYEPSSETTHKRSKKSRAGGRAKNANKRTKKGKEIESNKGKEIESNKIPTLPEPPIFEPMENIYELHKGYTTLPPEIERGTISPLILFRLFFSDYYLKLIVNHTNEYEKIK